MARRESNRQPMAKSIASLMSARCGERVKCKERRTLEIGDLRRKSTEIGDPRRTPEIRRHQASEKQDLVTCYVSGELRDPTPISSLKLRSEQWRSKREDLSVSGIVRETPTEAEAEADRERGEKARRS
ncbi:hypothetical protein L484_007271 [Morus notabilis]|uniref:Uncharacterized protein n=1 Tax=Morus notabilis TaxID=981085 RepID=W9R9W5_9ROSA|nr:hypothetical protein L484_007271 [Morus notabilis]